MESKCGWRENVLSLTTGAPNGRQDLESQSHPLMFPYLCPSVALRYINSSLRSGVLDAPEFTTTGERESHSKSIYGLKHFALSCLAGTFEQPYSFYKIESFGLSTHIFPLKFPPVF